MADVKAWKYTDPGQPDFPDDFEIAKKAVLQVTDIKTNHNKYYAIELHKGTAKGAPVFRVFTHYGRTDDLETNPNAGQKECRYTSSQGEAELLYQSIYNQKTSPRKGYKEVALASSKIGSHKARGTSSGDVDDKTFEKLSTKNGDAKPVIPPSSLDPAVQRLVRYIYDEATNALTSTVNAKITANGIETPLGILTIGQIDKGVQILEEMYDIFSNQKGKHRDNELQRLTGDFYTAIPHRLGRTRQAIASAVINTLEAFEQKQNTLQLMKDMLQVNGEGGNVLFNAQIDQEYSALKCDIQPIATEHPRFQELADHVMKSQVRTKNIKVKNIWSLRRDSEWTDFDDNVGNQRLLFHGSRIQNWVGILSRGILLPKIVVSMGVHRTDAGWLGHGIYFGDAACTSSFYATPGRQRSSFMTIARVALGKAREYTKITYGLSKPPDGYDSCHGVSRRKIASSEFEDDEYVIYTNRQQRLEYLVEFTGGFH